MFGAVFFVTIGMLLEPRAVTENWQAVLVIAAALVLGKLLSCAFGTFLAGYEPATAIRVGLGLGQIGEFSFIIAALGVTLGVTSPRLYPIAVAVSLITTILTPYMIRHADKLVALHDRFAPDSLRAYQRDYLAWVRSIGGKSAPDPVRKLVRTIVLQLGINVALIAACFIGALFVQQRNPPWLRELPPWTGGPKVVLVLAALVLSLPVVIAFLRKLQALSMLLAEIAIREGSSERQKIALRAMLSNTILFVGAVTVSVLLLVLSAPLLPPWEVFVFLCLLAALLAVLLRTHFVRIYSRAQNVVRETLARPHEPHETHAPARGRPSSRSGVVKTSSAAPARKWCSPLATRFFCWATRNNSTLAKRNCAPGDVHGWQRGHHAVVRPPMVACSSPVPCRGQIPLFFQR